MAETLNKELTVKQIYRLFKEIEELNTRLNDMEIRYEQLKKLVYTDTKQPD